MKYKLNWNISRVTPLCITILYVLISWIWIFFSDRFLAFISKDHQMLLRWSTIKGGLFVLVTAILLYFLIQSGYQSLKKSKKDIQNDREMLECYRLLADEVLDIIIFIRPDGQIIDANEATVKRYGYTREELTNMPVHKLRLPEDHSAIPYFLQNASRECNLN